MNSYITCLTLLAGVACQATRPVHEIRVKRVTISLVGPVVTVSVEVLARLNNYKK